MGISEQHSREATSIGEDYPKQQERCREALEACRACGPAGSFAVAMIGETLKRADVAMASGDIIQILAAYEEMKLVKL